MKAEPGTRVNLRCYYGNQTVDAKVVRRFLFMRLVTWGVRESWDGTPPFSEYEKTAWRPVWRMW
jgi:hypothetical protein